MNALDAGLLCTLLLIGTVAALLGGMSAARRRRRASFALCLVAAVPDFALLSVLLARLPDCETLAHAPLWTAAALISTALSLLALCLMLRGSRRQLSPFFHQGELRLPALRAVLCVGKRPALPEKT